MGHLLKRVADWVKCAGDWVENAGDFLDFEPNNEKMCLAERWLQGVTMDAPPTHEGERKLLNESVPIMALHFAMGYCDASIRQHLLQSIST